MDFDAIVIGAGPGGCIAARELARAGINVGLFDLRDEKSLGKDIIIEMEPQIFEKVGLKKPGSDEIPYHAKRIKVFSTTGGKGSVVDNPPAVGVFLSRFVQGIAGQAKDAGTKFFAKYKAVAPIVEDGKVCGVTFMVGRKKEEVRASLVIDATGFNGALVRQLDGEMGMEFYDDANDVLIAANYFHETKDDKLDDALKAGICGDDEIWTTLGKCGVFSTEFSWASKEKKRAYLLVGYKEQWKDKINDVIKTVKKEHGYFGKKVCGGAANIRIRHPLPRLVTNGFMVIGEAACQVISMLGSGVASALWAGYLAGQTAAPVLKSGKPATTEALWPYAWKFHSERGARLMVFAATRLIMEKFNDDQVRRMVEEKLMSKESIEASGRGELPYVSPAALPGQILGLLKNPDLGWQFAKVGRYGSAAYIHYRNYPKTYDPKTFNRWLAKERTLFEPLKKGN